MDWIELIIHTTTRGSDPVSSILMDLGASGTMVEDRADLPDPDKPNGIWEIMDPRIIDAMPEDVQVHAWFAPDHDFSARMASLSTRLALLRSDHSDYGTLRLDSRTTPDENWAELWKTFFHPTRAGKHLVVCPTWESFSPEKGDHIIRMDPGMAFGSGSHETTLMCLSLLEKEIHGGEKVIDVGTGSGILAIGAALSGAGHVLAIDIDPDAVRVARENVKMNHVEKLVSVQQGNLLDRVDECCDICAANIIAEVICSFAAPLLSHIRPGGSFICSGIIEEKENMVRTALSDAGYEIREVKHRGECVAFLAGRP